MSISGLHGHHHGPGDRRLVRSPSAVAVVVVERASLRQRPSFRHVVVLLRQRLGSARVAQARHAQHERDEADGDDEPLTRLPVAARPSSLPWHRCAYAATSATKGGTDHAPRRVLKTRTDLDQNSIRPLSMLWVSLVVRSEAITGAAKGSRNGNHVNSLGAFTEDARTYGSRVAAENSFRQ